MFYTKAQREALDAELVLDEKGNLCLEIESQLVMWITPEGELHLQEPLWDFVSGADPLVGILDLDGLANNGRDEE